MATKTITQLPSASTLLGNETFETVQLSGGFLASVKTQARDINQSPLKYVDFDQGSYPAQSHREGIVQWDNENHTLKVFNDESEMELQVGQETLVRVYNNSGATISDGTPVYATGSLNGLITIAPAKANSFSTLVSLAVTTHDMPNNSSGYTTKRGIVRGIDTSAFFAGAPLYVSPVSAGKFQYTKPISPYRVAICAMVVVSDAVSGSIFVEPAVFSDQMKIIGYTLPLTGVTDTQIPLTGTISEVSTSATGDISSDWSTHGHHAFIKVNSLTTGGDIVLTGDSVDESTGIVTLADSETITAYASAARPAILGSQYYQTNKKWHVITNIDVTSGTIVSINFNYGYVGYPDMGNRNFRFIGYRLEAYSDGIAPDMRFIWTKIDGTHGKKKLFLDTIEDIGIDSDNGGQQIRDHIRTGADERGYDSPLANLWGSGELFVLKSLDLNDYWSNNLTVRLCQPNDINAKNSHSGYTIRIEGEPEGGGITNVQYIVLKLFYELG